MLKTEQSRVQRLARKHFKRFVGELRKLGQLGAVRSLIASVDRVANQRMPQVLHVHPDLVGTARFKAAGHERGKVVAL